MVYFEVKFRELKSSSKYFSNTGEENEELFEKSFVKVGTRLCFER